MQGTEEVRYGFTSREHDALTGLIHYRARAYDPLTGQFLQRDPIGFASGDLNLYAYVENDPYNWTDPSGLTAFDGSILSAGTRAMGANAVRNIGMGVLGLATGIASFLTGYTALDTVLNQADGGDGDGNDPRGDDDGDQQPGNEPPDPNREVAELLEAITTGEGLSRDAGERIAEAIEGRTQGDAEDFLDRLLRDGLGWERRPSQNGLGDRWLDGRGRSVRTSSGYPDGNFTGPGIKRAPYAIIRIGGADLRVGLE